MTGGITVSARTNRDDWRAYGGGVQIQVDNETCTLGFVVTSPAGQRGFLTASHCEASYGQGALGATVYQNTPNATNAAVGAVAHNPAWTYPYCGSIPKCTQADVMFVSASNASDAQKRVFAPRGSPGTNSQGGSITYNGWWWNMPSTYDAFDGQYVDKVGRTTGWTRGWVNGTCQDVKTFRVMPLDSVLVLCTTQVEAARGGLGDSGASVFLFTGNYLYPVGILFGVRLPPASTAQDWDGSYYCTAGCAFRYSPFSQIMAHFGVWYNPIP